MKEKIIKKILINIFMTSYFFLDQFLKKMASIRKMEIYSKAKNIVDFLSIKKYSLLKCNI